MGKWGCWGFLGVYCIATAAVAAVSLTDMGPLEAELEAQLTSGDSAAPEDEFKLLLSMSDRAADSSYTDRRAYRYSVCYAASNLKKFDQALEAEKQLKADALAVQDEIGMAYAELCASYMATSHEQYELAFQQALFAAKRAEALPNYPKLSFRAGIMAGDLASRREHFDDAIENYQLALRGAENMEDKRRQASVNFSLSGVYQVMGQYAQALTILDKALQLAIESNQAKLQADINISRGSVFSSLGQLDNAQKVYEEVLDAARQTQDHDHENNSLVNLSDIALQRHQYAEAERRATEVKSLAEAHESWDIVATAEANIGMALAGEHHVELATPHIRAAMKYYEDQKQQLSQAEIQREWSEALAGNGRFEAALDAFKEYKKLTDNVLKGEREKAILQIQQQLDSEKKEKQIQLLSKENALQNADIENRKLEQRTWWLLAMLFGALFSLALLLYGRVRKVNMKLNEKNQELDFLSTRDPLTTLYNRRYFQTMIGSIDLSKAERRATATSEQTTRALYLIDIDHFKKINDHYGHAAGDAVLVETADRLRKGLREHDVIVRWGGEEFLVFAQQLPLARVHDLAHRILELFSFQSVAYQDKSIRITASVGYCLLPLRGESEQLLSWDRGVNIVDMALYLAKAHGRNRAYGVTALKSAAPEVMETIEKDLEVAWQNGLVELERCIGEGEPS